MYQRSNYNTVGDMYKNTVRPQTVYSNYNQHQGPLQVSWTKTKSRTNLSDPKVWGPSFWFTLHNGAIHYPVSASNVHKQWAKNFIKGLPVMLPCEACKPHAQAYIQKKLDKLDSIVSGRDNLFNFFVDFHNQVNKKEKKKTLTPEEARNLYSTGVDINIMKYE